jgi:hypothetical protein
MTEKKSSSTNRCRYLPIRQVEVVIPDSGEDVRTLNADLILASLPSLKRIWDNPQDAEYDKL